MTRSCIVNHLPGSEEGEVPGEAVLSASCTSLGNKCFPTISKGAYFFNLCFFRKGIDFIGLSKDPLLFQNNFSLKSS